MYHHHHHHVVPLPRISLTLSSHFTLSFIASGRSSGLHPVSNIAAVRMFKMVVLILLGHIELVLTSPVVSCVSGSSNLDSFRDGRRVAV